MKNKALFALYCAAIAGLALTPMLSSADEVTFAKNALHFVDNGSSDATVSPAPGDDGSNATSDDGDDDSAASDDGGDDDDNSMMGNDGDDGNGGNGGSGQ